MEICVENEDQGCDNDEDTVAERVFVNVTISVVTPGKPVSSGTVGNRYDVPLAGKVSVITGGAGGSSPGVGSHLQILPHPGGCRNFRSQHCVIEKGLMLQDMLPRRQ